MRTEIKKKYLKRERKIDKLIDHSGIEQTFHVKGIATPLAIKIKKEL